jgi:endonuclease/exonuclease/phosphatase family metal-dependent hydrolase
MVVSDRLRDAVAVLAPDVLGMQEVDRGQPRSGGADLAMIAAQAMSVAEINHRFVPAIIGTPGLSFRAASDDDPGEGEPQYGVALAVRAPVVSWHVIRLPAAPVRSPVMVAGRGGGLLLLRDEPRVLLAAVVDSDIGPITVATTHLSFVPGWNVRQLRQVVAALRLLPAPRLLLGDLNLPGRLGGLASGWRMLARRATYPSPAPRLQFDHVLLDPRGGGSVPPVRRVSSPAVALSDHRPLVVELGGEGLADLPERPQVRRGQRVEQVRADPGDVAGRGGDQRRESRVGQGGDLPPAVGLAVAADHPPALLQPGHGVREPTARRAGPSGELAHP